MYKSINLIVNEDDIPPPPPKNSKASQNFSNIAGLIKNGCYQVEDIINKNFPDKKKYHIFISHSHQDINIATSLENKLKEYEINCFIDSSCWSHIDEVLNDLDKKHCMNEDGDTFNYSKRNKTTSIVHSILNAQLSTLMDKCDFVIFINTENSLKKENRIDEEKQVTYSPWLYHELLMTKLLRRTLSSESSYLLPESSSLPKVCASQEAFPKFEYNVSTLVEKMPSFQWSEFLDIFEQDKSSSGPKAPLRRLLQEIIQKESKTLSQNSASEDDWSR